MSEIGERVKKIVVEHLGVEPEKVVDNASFIDDLGADSLDTVELVMAFEEEFGCEIPDDAAETILTVGDATKFLEKNAIAGFGNPVYWRDGASRRPAGSRRPAPVAEVPVACHHDGSRASKNGTLVTGPNQVYARFRRKFNDHDGSYRPGVGSRKQARG